MANEFKVKNGLKFPDNSVQTTAFTGSSGTVTSVGLSLPAVFTVTGSPVTTSGTLTAALASQTANQVWAAPNGTTGAPTFRALVAADIPALDLAVHLPDSAYKKIVRVATTADVGPSTFSANVLTGYSNTQSLACTTTAASTSVTTTSTAGLKVGAVVSTATVQVAAGTSVASITSATVFVVNNRANITTTAITGTGATATATFAAQTYAPYAVGSSIVVSGATPATYNGTKTVTACTTTSVAWASTETVTATVQGTITFTIAAGTSITTAFAQTIAALAIDGITLAANDRVLVKDQNTLGGLVTADAPKYNGIYYVSATGSASVPWTLTRALDADASTDLDGAIVNVSVGTANYGKSYKTRFKGTDTLNTTQMFWGRVVDVNSSSRAALPVTAIGTDIATDTETVVYNTGNVADYSVMSLGVKTLQAVGASTYTRAATLYIAGAPVASTNATITTPYSLYIAGGNSYLGAACTATSFNNITGLASVAPVASGTAAVGTSTLAARQDHVHPISTLTLGTGLSGTSYNGSAAITAAVSYGTTATTACVGNDLRLSDTRNTTNSVTFNTSGGAAAGSTFNGSAARTIDYSTVGAAAASHTHSYLPLSGGTLTGQLVASKAWDANPGAAAIYISGGGAGRIDWSIYGTGAPTVATRSEGTKLVLNPTLNGTEADLAIGVASNAMWFSVTNNSSYYFNWYHAATNTMSLLPSGILNVVTGFRVNGAATTGRYLRGNGTNFVSSAIQAADVPTLNQNTAGSAGSVENALTFNTTGGAPAGSTFNGSAARTIDYSTVGAAASSHTHSYLPLAGGTLTGQFISTDTYDAATGGGNIYLNSATGNRIDFNTNGVAAPAFTTRSAGTKLVLYPNIGAAAVDYAIGIESSNMWFSVHDNSTGGFKWYGGTTNTMSLYGNGILSVATGFRINGAATSGQYLRGNGTNFVSSAIQAGDLPSHTHSVTVGSTAMTTGSTYTTIAGLSSVTSTYFTGAVKPRLVGSFTVGASDANWWRICAMDGSNQPRHCRFVVVGFSNHLNMEITFSNGAGGDYGRVEVKVLGHYAYWTQYPQWVRYNPTGTNAPSYVEMKFGSAGATYSVYEIENFETSTALTYPLSSTGSSADAGTKLQFFNDAGLLRRQGYMRNGVTGETLIETSSSVQMGSLGIGTAASGTAGEIRATNNITAYYSDRRLKDISGEIKDALGKVERMSGIYFQNNELAESFGYTDKSRQVGVIAQQVQQELPEAVKRAPFDSAFTDDGEEYSVSGEEYLTVQYEKLVPVLLQAIKELNAKVELLEERYNA